MHGQNHFKAFAYLKLPVYKQATTRFGQKNDTRSRYSLKTTHIIPIFNPPLDGNAAVILSQLDT
jgi:hypothetical protein